MWLRRLMKNRRALDMATFVAWHGHLTGYYLVLAAVLAAILKSSQFFLLAAVVFVASIPIAGFAFCLLSITVFVHAIETRVDDSARATPPWTIIPFVGVSRS